MPIGTIADTPRYRCFTRTWWRAGNGPGGRVPGAGPRRYTGHPKGLTVSEAQRYCTQWNNDHEPGKMSRKCEFESY
jgi:hypothetical protein